MASFLVIAPHPDDGELGMGGTILKLARQGHRVHLLDITDGEPTPRGSPEIRAAEASAAAAILGVPRSCLGLQNRQVTHNLESRHKLAAVIRVHRPDVLFVPYPIDAHPDHVAVSRIAEDARFDAKLTRSTIPGEPWHPKRIIYYFCTHLRMSFQPTFCIDVSETHDAKMAACNCYQSQGLTADSDLMRMVSGIAAYFGGRIGTRFAEPFFSHEVIGLAGLDQLI
ncbi:MAG: bacillithiol biosynthesis deacetylase BshB1 [Phycisphaerae bacterium]|nr:bacillithiol biosynthesis deacetylase BshB1 [Phycisphaerae bacterium]MDW8261757.1 bacillithiol biosynthesis deacetylase BshB1 [Phycisphaerales bacterium]